MSLSASNKILVSYHDADTRDQLRSILIPAGYQVVEATNGVEALEVFKREEPDMVILDVMMPIMNGYVVAQEITQKLAKNFVPVIFLTSSGDDETTLKCIDSGGDDVLVTPINGVLMLAKLRAMQRILSLYVSLEDYRARTEEELLLARHVFSTITMRMKHIIPGMNHWTRSAGHLPGDLVLYDTTPSGKVYAMVADFTGHGLAAAVGAIPVADIFFALTKKDFPLPGIIVEINRKLRQIFPIGHFCAAAFVSSDPGEDQVKVWNGGLPEVLLVSQDRDVVQRFPSTNLALGIVSMDDDDVVMTTTHDVLGSKLVLYTDGLTESSNKAGEHFGEARLIQAIKATAGQPLFDGLKRRVVEFCDGIRPHDDVSLLVLPVKDVVETSD